MRTFHYRLVGVFTLTLCTVTATIRPLGALPTFDAICHEATSLSYDAPLPLNETISWHGIEDEAFFVLDIPTPGWLALEIGVPAQDITLPWFRLTFRDRSALDPEIGVVVLERLPRRKLFAITMAGTYIVHVEGVSIGLPLPSLKISSRFLEFSDGANPWDIKPKDDEDDGDLTEEADNEILPLWADPFEGNPLCQGEEPTDDISLCAHPMKIGESWESTFQDISFADHDYFTFVLPHAGLIHVFTTGPADTMGVLFSEQGQELAVAKCGGSADNFALLARLNEGRYYVRVKGNAHSTGRYRIHLENPSPSLKEAQSGKWISSCAK